METSDHDANYFHIKWPATLPKCDGACQIAEEDPNRYDGVEKWVDFEKVKRDAKLGCPKCMIIYHCCLRYELPAHLGRLDVDCSYGGPGCIEVVQRRKVFQPLRIWRTHVQVNEPKPEWCVIRPRRLPIQSRREEYMSMLDAWRTGCEAQHEDCVAKDTRLPRRVLNVGSHTAPTLSLHCSSHDIGQYVALSYCWGEQHPPKTQLSNLEQRQRGIDFDSLPQTFKDAVKVTRDLGIRYLWIDSLCIVQDQSIDWEKESSKMATYYNNAYLVIAASMAINSTEGFLDGPVSQEFTIPAYSTEIGQIINLDSTISRIYKSTMEGASLHNHGRMIRASPLNRRAWALQEHLLARRIVHFTRYEVIWECTKDLKCECTQLDHTLSPAVISTATNSTMRKHQLWYWRFGNTSLHRAWQNVLTVYLTMALSYDSDIFPALSGLAKVWQSRGAGKYLAGFWEERILESVTWVATRSRYLQRRQKYRAPSWSPFSVEVVETNDKRMTQAKFDFLGNDQRLARRDAVVTNSGAILRGSDPTGQIESAFIQLHGHVIRFNFPSQYDKWVKDWGWMQFDICMDYKKEITLTLLLIGYEPAEKLIALVLMPSDEGDVYERVGRVHIWRGRNDELGQQFRAKPKETITII